VGGGEHNKVASFVGHHENFARASSALDHGIVVYGNKIIVMILDFLVIRLVRFLGINLM
jgi:hypothetical protein